MLSKAWFNRKKLGPDFSGGGNEKRKPLLERVDKTSEEQVMNFLANPGTSVLPPYLHRNDWLLANYITHHICGYRGYFSSLVDLDKSSRNMVCLETGQCIYPCGKGTVAVQILSRGSWVNLSIDDVYYIPGKLNVISLHLWNKRGFYLAHNKDTDYMRLQQDRNMKILLDTSTGLIRLPIINVSPINNVPSLKNSPSLLNPKDEVLLWHCRLGHRDMSAVNPKVIPQTDAFVRDKETLLAKCDMCKSMCLSFTNSQPSSEIVVDDHLATSPLPGEHISINVIVKKRKSNSGKCVMWIMTDDVTRYCWAQATQNVLTCLRQIKNHIHKLKIMTGKRVNVIDASIIRSSEMVDLIQTYATKKNITLIRDHKQSFEKTMKQSGKYFALTSVANSVQQLVSATNMSLNQWDVLVDTAAYLHNMTYLFESARALCSKYFAFKPDYIRLRAIGCQAIVNSKEEFAKYGKNITHSYVLVGYTRKNRDYLLLDPSSGKFKSSADCLVLEEDVIKYAAPKSVNFVCHSKIPAPRQIRDMSSSDISKTFALLRNVLGFDIEAISQVLAPYNSYLDNFELDCQTISIKDSRDIHHRRSKSLDKVDVAVKNEFELIYARGFGNCLYNSISLSLFATEEKSDCLRLVLLRHIVKHWSLLSPLMHQISNYRLGEIVDAVKTLTKWGTDIHIFLFSQLCQRPFYLHKVTTCSGKAKPYYLNSNPENENKLPVYINLYMQHFQPLIKKPGVNVTIFSRRAAINYYTCVTHLYKFDPDAKEYFPKTLTSTIYPSIVEEIDLGSNDSPSSSVTVDESKVIPDNKSNVLPSKIKPKCLRCIQTTEKIRVEEREYLHMNKLFDVNIRQYTNNVDTLRGQIDAIKRETGSLICDLETKKMRNEDLKKIKSQLEQEMSKHNQVDSASPSLVGKPPTPRTPDHLKHTVVDDSKKQMDCLKPSPTWLDDLLNNRSQMFPLPTVYDKPISLPSNIKHATSPLGHISNQIALPHVNPVSPQLINYMGECAPNGTQLLHGTDFSCVFCGFKTNSTDELVNHLMNCHHAS